MNNATSYTVSEVSERIGFTIDTLRYYERLGLIERIERTAGGKRRYRADDIGWLEFVLAAITHKIDYYRGVLAPEGMAAR